MSHFISQRFCHAYQGLPRPLQERVERVFRQPLTHPLSSGVVRICDRRLRALPVAPGYLAIGVPMSDGVQWFWVGTREDYRAAVVNPPGVSAGPSSPLPAPSP